MTPNPYFSVPRLKTTPLKATIRFEDIRDPRISRFIIWLENSRSSWWNVLSYYWLRSSFTNLFCLRTQNKYFSRQETLLAEGRELKQVIGTVPIIKPHITQKTSTNKTGMTQNWEALLVFNIPLFIMLPWQRLFLYNKLYFYFL